jgi:hypothetical protein
MTIDKAIAEKFTKLVAEGRQILARAGWDGNDYHGQVGDVDYVRFRTEALNLVRRACGEDSDHYAQLKRLAEEGTSAFNSYYFKDCFGALEAADRDFKEGMLLDVRTIVSAEVLDDFLEQAEHLLVGGYHVPAASLAGAVLEDTLRTLSTKKGLPVPDKTTIDGLNSSLAKAGAYDKLILKRITAIADIRNNADHGHFDKFSKDDVVDMMKWVRRFTADFLH